MILREIAAVFETSSQQYSYLTDDSNIKVGDHAVVVTPTGIKVVKVVQVDTKTNKATKLIVGRVDLEEYARKLYKLAAKQRIDEQIAARVKKLTEQVLVEQLAERDPELRSLLDELKSL